MASFKYEVLTSGDKDFTSNALRFATSDEAQQYGSDLFMRWTAVVEGRVTESTDPVSYKWENGRLVKLNEEAASVQP